MPPSHGLVQKRENGSVHSGLRTQRRCSPQAGKVAATTCPCRASRVAPFIVQSVVRVKASFSHAMAFYSPAKWRTYGSAPAPANQSNPMSRSSFSSQQHRFSASRKANSKSLDFDMNIASAIVCIVFREAQGQISRLYSRKKSTASGVLSKHRPE